MADKPKGKADSGDGSNHLLGTVITIIIVIFIASHYVEKLGTYVDERNLGASAGDGQLRILPAGDLEVGKKIINSVNTKVRQTMGGAIIGEQSKRSIGKILEGPVEAFGQNWLRIDYEDVPDGWVSANDVTSKVGFFRALNILPIVLDIFRPIGIILAIIFFALIIFISSKQKKVEKLIQNKKRVEQESFIRKIENNSIKEDEPINLASLGLPLNLPTGDASDIGFSFQVEEQTPTGPKNQRWERVKDLMNSHTASDWRQAIIEADIILDEMLDRIGYEGESIGDRLKQVEESDFVTLNKAWEAHKIRNHIAHRGGDFVFSKSEADRVIRLYEQVFEEFYYI